MPHTLSQLKDARDNCFKRIEELKETAKDKGASTIGSLSINPLGILDGLYDMSLVEIESFLSFFPRYPEILKCLEKVVKEEKKRRYYQERINTIRIEKEKKIKRKIQEEMEDEECCAK